MNDWRLFARIVRGDSGHPTSFKLTPPSPKTLAQGVLSIQQPPLEKATTTPQLVWALESDGISMGLPSRHLSGGQEVFNFVDSVKKLYRPGLELTAENIGAALGVDSYVFYIFSKQLEKHISKDGDLKGEFARSLASWKDWFKKYYNEKKLDQKFYRVHLYLISISTLIFLEIAQRALPTTENAPDSALHQFSRHFPEIVGFPFYRWWASQFDIFRNWFRLLNFSYFAGYENSISQDIFRLLYQSAVSPSVRHGLGEFYTPPRLATLMLDHVYQFGESLLDPAVGSGVFLIETLRKISSAKDKGVKEKREAISRLYGIDVNPIATLTTKINIVLMAWRMVPDLTTITSHIIFANPLIEAGEDKALRSLAGQIDTLVGNPAWLTLKNIHHLGYKEELKRVASELGLKPRPHQIPNIEVSALFLYKGQQFLVSHGKVGLIVSEAFLTGSNHDLTRGFRGFSEIEVWRFDRDLFHVPNICIFAQFDPENQSHHSAEMLRHMAVPQTTFHVTDLSGVFDFEVGEADILVPSQVETHKAQILVHRLVKWAEKQQMEEWFPKGPNHYKSLPHRGVDIFPRSLTALLPQSGGHGECFFVPQPKQSKPPWNFDLIPELPDRFLSKGPLRLNIDSSCIFPVLKSKHLAPFTYFFTDYAFIPIRIDPTTQHYQKISPNDQGWGYYQALENIFAKHHKKGAAITALWGRMNYQNNLLHPRHQKPYKVVYQRSGSYVKACLVKGPHIFIDTTNYALEFGSLDEAYYVLGWLNAPNLSKVIQIEKSARDIHKLPFDYHLPEFAPGRPQHQKLVALAKKMESRAQKFASEAISRRLQKEGQLPKIGGGYDNVQALHQLPLRRIQKEIYQKLGWRLHTAELSGDFRELNSLVLSIARS